MGKNPGSSRGFISHSLSKNIIHERLLPLVININLCANNHISKGVVLCSLIPRLHFSCSPEKVVWARDYVTYAVIKP